MNLDSNYSPNKSALVLLDVQNGFLDGDGAFARCGLVPPMGKDRSRLVGALQSLVQAMRHASRPIFFISTVLRSDLGDCYLAPRWRECLVRHPGELVEGTGSAAVIAELAPKESDFLIVKKGHSAFQFTTLDRALAALDIEVCVFAGNVLSAMDDTIRQGAALGYENVVVSDASFPLGSPLLRVLRRYAVQAAQAEVEDWLAKPSLSAPVAEIRPCLVVIDMQNDFVHRDGVQYKYTESEIEEIIGNNLKILASMRSRDLPVIFVKNIRGFNRAIDTASPRQGLRQHGEAYSIEGSWGAEILGDLNPEPPDYVVAKHSNGAFATTHLHRMLRNLGVNTLLVTGGAVGGCVPATVLEGVGLGYRVIVASDATYPPSGRELGFASISSKVEVKTTAATLAWLDQIGAGVGRRRPVRRDAAASPSDPLAR